jgi:hypothetical protein
MSTNTIVDRAITGSGHRAKKTTVFLEQKAKIKEALARGSSERSIHRELKKDGYDVGSLTWFRKLVAKHVGGDQGAVADVPEPASALAVTTPSVGKFGDGRFAPDYE